MKQAESLQGIVIQTMKYKESSVIAKIYSLEYGILSFIINGVRKKNSNKAAILQPLSLVNIQSEIKPNTTLHFIKSIALSYTFNAIPFNIYKSSIAFFMAEIIEKYIREEESNPQLYQFLEQQITYLDSESTHYQNTHLFFLSGLTEFLGIQPNLEIPNTSPPYFFDLEKARITHFKPKEQHFLDTNETALFIQLFENNKSSFSCNNILRKKLLKILLLYITKQFDVSHSLKSLPVLESLWD